MKDQHSVLKDQFCILDNTLQPYLFVDAWLAATSCTPIIMFRTLDLRTRHRWSPRPARTDTCYTCIIRMSRGFIGYPKGRNRDIKLVN